MLSPANPAAPAHGSVGCVLAWPLNPFTGHIPESTACGTLWELQCCVRPESPCAGAGDEQPSTCEAKKASKGVTETAAELAQAEMTFLWQLPKLEKRRLLKQSLRSGSLSLFYSLTSKDSGSHGDSLHQARRKNLE